MKYIFLKICLISFVFIQISLNAQAAQSLFHSSPNHDMGTSVQLVAYLDLEDTEEEEEEGDYSSSNVGNGYIDYSQAYPPKKKKKKNSYNTKVIDEWSFADSQLLSRQYHVSELDVPVGTYLNATKKEPSKKYPNVTEKVRSSNSTPYLSREEQKAILQSEGLYGEIEYNDRQTPESLDLLMKLKKDELYRDEIISRSPPHYSILGFFIVFFLSFLDPFIFIPAIIFGLFTGRSFLPTMIGFALYAFLPAFIAKSAMGVFILYIAYLAAGCGIIALVKSIKNVNSQKGKDTNYEEEVLTGEEEIPVEENKVSPQDSTEDPTSLDKAESILEELPATHIDRTERIEDMKTPMPSAETQTEISLNLDLALLEKAQAVAADMGLDLSSVVKMFLIQMVRENALPFTPNANQHKEK